MCLAFSDDLRDACGPMQFAVGRPGGEELMFKSLYAWTLLRLGAVMPIMPVMREARGF